MAGSPAVSEGEEGRHRREPALGAAFRMEGEIGGYIYSTTIRE